jgi:acyl-CoA thioesterase FadM
MSAEELHGFVNARGIGPIIKSVSIHYRSPAAYPDLLIMGVRVPTEHVGQDRFVQEFCCLSHATGRVVADGTATVVTYDYARGCKAPIPEHVLRAFAAGMASFHAASIA